MVASFIEIPPSSRKIAARDIMYWWMEDGQMDGRQPTDGQKHTASTAYCWWSHNYLLPCGTSILDYSISILSAGVSLNEAPSRTTTIGPHFLGTVLVVILQNNNRHTSARAQRIFPILTRGPRAYVRPPARGTGVFPRALSMLRFLTVTQLRLTSFVSRWVRLDRHRSQRGAWQSAVHAGATAQVAAVCDLRSVSCT